VRFGDGQLDTSQIEDRRGMPGVAVAGGGVGIVGLIVFLLTQFLGGGSGGGSFSPGGMGQLQPAAPAQPVPQDTDEVRFVTEVVNNVQATWAQIFSQSGRAYSPTRLVLFTSSTQSGCGVADSSTGPFYCPLDSKVYLDLGFFDELRTRFQAPGDFAQAYVIAHEFGHHVQSLLGIERQVRQQQQSHPDQQNVLSVRLELQADCFAGVWAHAAYAQGHLEPGDLQEGVAAAAAVGDDRIQRAATGRVNPETFTHGSAAQRDHWLLTGYQSGDANSCDTFSSGSSGS
jgi:predicted metalloprotease